MSAAESGSPGEDAGPVGRPAPRPRPHGSIRVLVVEDNAGDRWYFSELLRSRSFDVLSTEDAETAWAVFQDDPPPVILLDLLLPGMDGEELCRKIRAHPAGAECVILAVTGQTDPDAMGRILSAGANDFLKKPVDPHLLDIRLIIAERWVAEQRERRAAQDELARKTEELETLFRNLPDVFFSVDLEEERLIQISPASRRILGHEPDDLMGDPELWKRLLFPPEVPEGSGGGTPEAWDRVRRSALDGSVVREYPIQRDGSTRWLRANVWVGHDDRGRAVRADGVVSDISHLKRVNEELSRRNRELSALNRMAQASLSADSSDEALGGMLDEVVRVLDVPVAALEYLDEAGGCLVVAAIRGMPRPEGPRAETPLHRTLAGRAVRTREPVVETDPAVARAHGPAYLRDRDDVGMVAAFPLLVGDDVRGVLVLAAGEGRVLDVHEESLGASMANAAAGHVERLATEEALRENEARYRGLASQLQQANSELESFAYSISHDLRAPLRTMQGFAHALLQNFGDGLEPEARDYADRIIASGRHSEELIRDLLEYSRLSFERLETKPTELEEVLETALSHMRGDVDERGGDVEVRGPLPAVLGSRTILVQVLTNLLSNAVKFVPDSRRPEIVVRAEERGGEVRLWVEDNGVGIPPDQHERVFRVFERLVARGARPGTGIGLAIVRRGLQRMGGTSGVESLPDQGSAFWIQLPREARDDSQSWSRRR